jgi:S-adenosylmethionine:tRNA ribosyltransferase-isomerase
MNFSNINIEDYNYRLPDDRIAQFPLEVREHSKLLIVRDGRTEESIFSSISNFIPKESLLVWNNTRVIHARILFFKESGARIEIFCLEPVLPTREINHALQSGPGCEWSCLIGNARKWKEGNLKIKIDEAFPGCELTAEKISEENGNFIVRFYWNNEKLCWAEILEAAGKVPLPPYISREANENDNVRYQTVYAKNNGSVAAPTAGLHFSEKVIESLDKKGIRHANVTLHVGAGTFKPVTAEKIENHKMHTEQITLHKSDLEKIFNAEGRITVVGTTSLRTLESFYWLGVKLICNKDICLPLNIDQWDPYSLNLPQNISAMQSWQRLLNYMVVNNLEEISGETSLIIIPSYKIRTANILLTNFHQPRSTLLLLVAAFSGDYWRKAYDFALKNDFRFLSYGDACLFYLCNNTNP